MLSQKNYMFKLLLLTFFSNPASYPLAKRYSVPTSKVTPQSVDQTPHLPALRCCLLSLSLSLFSMATDSLISNTAGFILQTSYLGSNSFTDITTKKYRCCSSQTLNHLTMLFKLENSIIQEMQLTVHVHCSMPGIIPFSCCRTFQRDLQNLHSNSLIHSLSIPSALPSAFSLFILPTSSMIWSKLSQRLQQRILKRIFCFGKTGFHMAKARLYPSLYKNLIYSENQYSIVKKKVIVIKKFNLMWI